MKKQDLIEGTEYAYASYEHGSRTRVKLLEVDHKKTEPTFSIGGRQTGTRTVKVLRLLNVQNGHEFTESTGRNLRGLWADYAEEVRRRIASRDDARRYRHEFREREAANMLAFNALLLSLGAEERGHWLAAGGNANADSPEIIAQHLADLGFHVYAERETHFHFLLADDSILTRMARATNHVSIPANLIPTLLEATGAQA